MPMNRSLYPDNWSAISLEIRERSGWKCANCGVKNGAYIMRSKSDPEKWRYTTPGGLPMIDEYKLKVVLTVHHIGIEKPDGSPGDPRDKMDCRPDNLQALCQRCHLLADRDHHIQARKKTLAARRDQAAIAAGQMHLFSTDADQQLSTPCPTGEDDHENV